MADDRHHDDAHERARQRLEERTARLHRDAPVSQRSRSPRTSSRRPPANTKRGASQSGLPAAIQRVGSVFATIGHAIASGISSLISRLGPKGSVIALGVLALALCIVVGVFVVRGCTSQESVAPSNQNQEQAQDPLASIDQAALASLLGDDVTKNLVQAASTNADTAWIASHPEAYAKDGEAVQGKLLKLASVEPKAIPFVRGFPDAYPALAPSGSSDEVPPGEIPYLYQWDSRWGHTEYSSTAFALTGCCPTSMAMVYQGLTGKNDLSPYDMGLKAREGGYMAAYDGTDSSYLTESVGEIGLTCETLGVDADSLRSALSDGALVICNVGPGDFTEGGHFFVITGRTDEGTLTIHDPYSAERSNRTWDEAVVLGQTMALYAYHLA